jgi:hypothetical protein
MLSAFDGTERDLRAELDGPGGVDERIDAVGVAEKGGVFGDHGPSRGDRFLETVERGGLDIIVAARLTIGPPRVLDVAVGDGDQRHTRYRVDDLVGDPAGHEAGADQPDPDRPSGGGALRERRIHDDHRGTFSPPTLAALAPISIEGHVASLSEMTVTGSGHWIPIAGSL